MRMAKKRGRVVMAERKKEGRKESFLVSFFPSKKFVPFMYRLCEQREKLEQRIDFVWQKKKRRTS